MPSSPRPPFDDVRAAFDRLATPDKVAFVVEATFDTIGQALGETGRRFSDAVASFDVDALFRMDGTPDAPPASATPPPATPPPGAGPRPKRTPRPPADGGPQVN